MNKKTFLGCIVALTISSTPIHAVIIDYGPYLYDTETGLDWLDLSATYGLTYHQVNSRLQDNWRYASGSELNTLVTNATGLPVPNSGADFGTVTLLTSAQELNVLRTLADMFDPVIPPLDFETSPENHVLTYRAEGVLSDIGTQGIACSNNDFVACQAIAHFAVGEKYQAYDELVEVTANYINSGIGIHPDGASNQWGHFLVRQHDDTISDGLTPENPILPTQDQVQNGWNFVFMPGVATVQPLFIDPEVAIGYDYVIDSGPNFSSLVLPEVGDNEFSLYLWNGADWIFESILYSGDWFSFNGVGVDRFRILGIETSAGLDPNDPIAFVTGLTFSEFSLVNMRMTPLTINIEETVSEPSILALMGVGLIGLLYTGRRKINRLRSC